MVISVRLLSTLLRNGLLSLPIRRLQSRLTNFITDKATYSAEWLHRLLRNQLNHITGSAISRGVWIKLPTSIELATSELTSKMTWMDYFQVDYNHSMNSKSTNRFNLKENWIRDFPHLNLLLRSRLIKFDHHIRYQLETATSKST